MKRKAIFLSIILLVIGGNSQLAVAEKAAWKSPFYSLAESTGTAHRIAHQRIKFEGEITLNRVRAFMVEHENTTATVIDLVSHGGDVEAAIDLGNWILDKSLDVQVFVCFSACANYLFLAGKTKILKFNSYLLWHGGLHQRDYKLRYLQHVKRAFAMTPAKLKSLSKVQRRNFDREVEFQAAYIRVRGMEDRFMNRVGVNEYLFRLGQEPIWYEPDCWTANIPVMESLGVKGIQGPEEFGTLANLMRSPLPTILCQGTPVTFELDRKKKIKIVQK
jgi:hypothetical protein